MGSRRRAEGLRHEDVAAFWRHHSPWLETGQVPVADNPPVRRPIVAGLVERLLTEDRRFHLLVGARRIGKTTVMTQVVAELLARGVEPSCVWFLRLDHPLLLTRDLHTPLMSGMREEAAKRPLVWVFLDEVTALPAWDRWLKAMFDERWNVRVVATSSATAALRAGRDESGVGRWQVHELGPWTLAEFAAVEAPGDDSLPPSGPSEHADLGAALLERPPASAGLDALAWVLQNVGGFPEVSPEDSFDLRVFRTQRRLKDDAVDRVVYKDIPQSFAVKNPAVLEKLLFLLAGQVSQLVSPQSLAQSLGVSQPTVDAYLSYLVHSHLIFTTTNWAPTEETRQRRGRKVYFRDPAVRNAALLRGSEALSSEEQGLLAENLVASHLQSLATAEGVRLSHWRDRQVEVDLVYDHPSRPLAFEVGSTRHSRAGLRQLVARRPELRGRAWLVMREAPWRPAADDPDGIGTVSLATLLWVVSRQLARAIVDRLR